MTMATVEELLRACLYEQEALRRVLVRKGLVSNEEVLEEVKAVRRELERKRGLRYRPRAESAPAAGIPGNSPSPNRRGYGGRRHAGLRPGRGPFRAHDALRSSVP